jgi:uncharacterized protein (TIGR02118 family)
MIKVMTWFRRRPGMALDDFQRYWRTEHPRVVLQMPGLRKYCQNHVADAAYRDGRQPFCDGVAETWWDSVDALRDLNGTDELAAVMADEAEFIDADHRDQALVSEVVVVNGAIPPGTPPKQITWIRFRDDLTPEAAQAYWRDVHGPLAAALPGIRRYVQNHLLPGAYREGRPRPEYDGGPMVWFDDLDAMRTSARSAELAAVRADEAEFLAATDLPWVICQEHHII